MVRMGHLKKDLEDVEELAMTLAEEIVFQAEGRVHRKALRWGCPWGV